MDTRNNLEKVWKSTTQNLIKKNIKISFEILNCKSFNNIFKVFFKYVLGLFTANLLQIMCN